MYKLYQQGPDNSSTYGECFGSHPTSRGRLVGHGSRLASLIDQVEDLGHDNFEVYSGDNIVAAGRKSFFLLPSVAKEMSRRSREASWDRATWKNKRENQQ